jgi:hypothetical protein
MWAALLTVVAGVAVIGAGCGSTAKSTHQASTTLSSSAASVKLTPAKYTVGQVERAFHAAGISLQKVGFSSRSCPYLIAPASSLTFLSVSLCGYEPASIGGTLPLPTLYRKANVLVMYDAETTPGVPRPASVVAKIRHGLSLLPGNTRVSVVHLHVPQHRLTLAPFSAQEVERTFTNAGVPLKAVQPINLSGFPAEFRAQIRSSSPLIELQASAVLPRNNFVRIIIGRRVPASQQSQLISLLVDGHDAGSPEHYGDGSIFNVYENWDLTIPLERNIKTAIKRLENNAQGRMLIALRH